MDNEKTQEGQKKDKKKFIRYFFSSLPSSIPHIGSIYASAKNDLSHDKILDSLDSVKNLSEQGNSKLDDINNGISTLDKKLNKTLSMKEKKQKFTVVIPAGGEGGSLFPLNKVMPKCLVTIGRKSMIQHIIDSFLPYKDLFNEIIVITDKYSDAIEENIRQGRYGDFVKCQKISTTVPKALLKIESKLKNPFVLHYNDIIIENINWHEVYDHYISKKEQIRQIGMLLCSKYYPINIGVIKEGKMNMLESFEEKPKHLVGEYLANLGVGVFERELLNYIKNKDKGIFEDTIYRVIKAKRPILLHRVDKWYHIQDLQSLFYIQNEVDLSFLENRFSNKWNNWLINNWFIRYLYAFLIFIKLIFKINRFER